MSSLATHLATIRTTLNAQSLSLAKDMFIFDNVPNSTIEKTYKFMASKQWLDDLSKGTIDNIATVNIEVAYNVTQGQFTDVDEIAKVVLAEAYEDALYAAFCTYNITLGYSFEDDVGSQVVRLLMTFTIEYERDIE